MTGGQVDLTKKRRSKMHYEASVGARKMPVVRGIVLHFFGICGSNFVFLAGKKAIIQKKPINTITKYIFTNKLNRFALLTLSQNFHRKNGNFVFYRLPWVLCHRRSSHTTAHCSALGTACAWPPKFTGDPSDSREFPQNLGNSWVIQTGTGW